FLFTSGLVSMGLEVIWIRQFTPYLGNVVYTFAGILAVYLLATLIGSQDYRSRIQLGKNAEKASTWGLLALSSILPVVAADPLLSSGHLDFGGARLACIVFFCALTGYLTPLLVDFWSNGDPDKAGTAYAINICGSILGPLIAGFWLLPSFGERHATFVLSIPLFAIAGFVMLTKQREVAPQKTIFNSKIQFAAIAGLAIFLFSKSHDFETRFPERIVRRDYTATVIATGQGFDRNLLVNGIGMTNLTPITKYIAHLPLAYMARPPRNGLVICFGMGTSFRSMLSWGIPTTVVDLVPSVPPLMGYFHADAASLMDLPLSRVVIDDGRRFLDGSHQGYDVIVVDPPPPPAAAGSSLLYSREFYATVKKHLNEGGILQMWYPENEGEPATTVAVTKALLETFSHVRAFRSIQHFGIHYLASMDPLPPLTSQALVERMPPAAIRDFVDWGPESDPQKQFDLVLSQPISLRDIIAQAPSVPAISDDDPVNEYYFLRNLHFTAK
ncbi:MAG: fused MFS/spermidine synthase, partial [Acidobacteriota bacterium]|nr:fused MFS/spermidine synthase [Acidobacteriota bacterium]